MVSVFDVLSRKIDKTITVRTNQKIQFRDTGLFIHSSNDGKLLYSADGSSTDDHTFSGTVTFDDDVICSSDFQVDGSLIFGDAAVDTLTLTGSFAQTYSGTDDGFISTGAGNLTAGKDLARFSSTGNLSSTSNVVAIEQSTGACTSGANALYINATGTNCEAIKVEAGTVTFGESLSIGTTCTVNSAIISGGTNTFNITNGTASLDVAAASAVDINANLTVSGATTFTNGLTFGATNAGAIDFGAASKTLTVSETATIDQDIQQSASVQFNSITDGTLTATGGNITGVTALTGTTINATNYEANDSTAAMTITDTTGAVAILTTLALASGTTANEFSIDGTLGGNSDDAIPTEKAVKTYVDTAILTKDTFLELNDTPGTYTTANALYTTNGTPDAVVETTVILTEAANTFNVTKGTASLDVAAASAVDINANLTVSGATTFTNGLTFGATNAGAIDFGAASKTLTVSETATIDQDIQQSASVQFNSITDGTLTATGGNITGVTALTGTTINATNYEANDSTASIVISDTTGNIACQGATTFTTGTGLTTISGDLSMSGHKDSQTFMANAYQYPNPGTDWTPELNGAGLAQNLAAKKCWIPLNFLKIGDEIVSYKIVGDCTEAAALTLDAQIYSINKADPITTTAITGGAIGQVNTNGNFDVETTLSSAEIVATDKMYVIELTGTTGAGDSITVMGAEILINRK